MVWGEPFVLLEARLHLDLRGSFEKGDGVSDRQASAPQQQHLLHAPLGVSSETHLPQMPKTCRKTAADAE